MVRRCAGVLVAVSVLAAVGRLLAAAPEPLADNAALHYWRAFSVIPDLSDGQDAAVTALLDKLGAVNDEAAGAIAASTGAIKELRRGATCARCDWATPLEDGPEAILPHLSKARQMGRLACAHAHDCFQRGRSAEAINVLIATTTLGRHAASDGVLVSVLVGYAIEQQAIRVAARHLGELEPAELADFRAGSTGFLPRPPCARRCKPKRSRCWSG